jgi:hypothetical protein
MYPEVPSCPSSLTCESTSSLEHFLSSLSKLAAKPRRTTNRCTTEPLLTQKPLRTSRILRIPQDLDIRAPDQSTRTHRSVGT